jgi:DNA repair ATPase RecN
MDSRKEGPVTEAEGSTQARVKSQGSADDSDEHQTKKAKHTEEKLQAKAELEKKLDVVEKKLKEAKSELKEAKSELKEAKSELKEAEKNLENAKALGDEDAKSAARNHLQSCLKNEATWTESVATYARLVRELDADEAFKDTLTERGGESESLSEFVCSPQLGFQLTFVTCRNA